MSNCNDCNNSTTIPSGPIGPIGPAGPQGPIGSTGPQGTSGTPATITVGSVTSLPAGSIPTVTNVGTSTAAILDFGLTIGDPGSIWYVNPFAPSTLYNDNDLWLDTSNGDVYQQQSGSWVLLGNILGPQGPTGVTGPQGLQGIQGVQGPQGDPGVPGIGSNANFQYILSTGVPTDDGDTLFNAYSSIPGGTFSENNRYAFILSPGTYEMNSQLNLIYPYVDIISLTGQKDVVLTVTGGGQPLLFSADNINLTGINTDTEDLIISDNYRNINVINSGNNKYTITRNARKEVKNIYFISDNGDEYSLTPEILYYDDITQNPYRSTNVNINGAIKLLNSPSRAEIGFNQSYYNYDQPYQTSTPLIGGVFSLVYSTLVGTLNVGDTITLYDAGPTLMATGIILYDDALSSTLYFKLQAGTSFVGIVSLNDNTTSATATVTTPPLNPYGIFFGNGYGTPTTNTTAYNMTLTFIPLIDNTGVSIATLTASSDILSTDYQAMIQFSGNELSFFTDTSVTNNLGGTADIAFDTYASYIYLRNLSGTWTLGSITDITGNNSLNNVPVIIYANDWEYNFIIEKTFDTEYYIPFNNNYQ